MKYTPYEFQEKDAWNFARFTGIQHWQRGNEIWFKTCPYCRSQGKSNEKKFSINLITGQFKCFRASCGVTGNMITLSKDFDFSLGNEVDEYYKPKKKFKPFQQPKKTIVPKPQAIKYLESRGISQATAEKYEITIRNDNPNCLVFPFYDENGTLQYVKYRNMNATKENGLSKEWSEKEHKPILFGMKQCEDFTTLVVTEGQIDSLSVAESGTKNVVSVPFGCNGFTFLPYCWNWLCKFEKIIIFGDHEKGKITLLDEFRKRFGRKVWNIRPEDYLDCKDANEILQKYGKEQIQKCIENAEQPPIKRVIWLDEVEDINPYNIPKVKTGIWELDSLLYGGLPYGLTTVLAGEEGSGKSTFASQIAVSALSQGLNIFVYSGEMPNSLFKNWIDFQIAGGSRIEERRNDFGELYRYLKNSDLDMIRNWYTHRVCLYDESAIEDESETEYLLRTIEECILKHNIRFVLIDNLMTGIYADSDISSEHEENQMQIKFVMTLRKMAKKYDIVILLLVHKSKAAAYINNPNNAISGSKKITNVAGIVMTYDFPSSKELENGVMAEDQRKLILSKNRIFGRRNMKGIVLNYDEKSKRIYGNKDNLNKEYDLRIFEGSNNGFQDNDGEVPFT